MPNLREYFYPYIDNPGCKITYEYYKPSGTPYCKSIIYPGIAIPDYPTVAGSVYFTRNDAFWSGSSWTSCQSLWYMRQRDSSIIEEIVDEGLACPEWGAWGPLYHNFKNITHAYGDSGAEHVSIPICTQVRTGPGQFYTHCDDRWFSSCQFVQYHASWGGYNDVVEMNFSHGSSNRNEVPMYPPCANNPPGCPTRPPFNNSYWQKCWYAKGVGKIYGRILFYEQPHCTGYSTGGGTAWDHYLHTMYGG